MAAIALTPGERKLHRAAAHHLQPVAMVGNDGLTDGVSKEIDQALAAHGLVKVRVFSDDRTARQALLEQLADQLAAAAVQHIGKLLVLWRPPLDKPKVDRESAAPGPRTVKVVSFSKSGNHRATVRKVKVFGNERVTSGGQIKRMKKRVSSVKKKAQA